MVRSERTRRVVGALIGVGLIGAVWALLAHRQPTLILPSPSETWAAFVKLFRDGAVVGELSTTLGRAAVGVLLALAIGSVWGVCNGWSRWSAAITQPALSTMMALPPVVLVALGMVWLGPGGSVARLVICIVALPLIVVAVQEAIHDIDRDLLEMAHVFGLPRATVLRHVIGPGVTSPVIAALTVTFGQALRVTVMVELLAAADGVGAEVARARSNLTTADLFAWAVLLIVVVLIVELALLRPLTARLLRWRTASEARPASRSQPAPPVVRAVTARTGA